ncbi:MAG: NTP transferase domain-containing protein [Planctomycetia bacterium]|jgi:CMP-N,N'-diacetyllegionaminic acid synthase|nr:NTP transferase domain-containing protein [Planctomycetia bacterium]
MNQTTPPNESSLATAVVIGRAGSKGLPRKHVRLVGGVPMIARSVGHALASRRVGRVLCSTDGEAIASAAAAGGAEVLLRPAVLASDHATVDAGVRHAIETSGDDSEVVVILYGSIPIRPDDLIDRAVERLVDTGADSVQSYSPVGKHHPFWTCRVGDDGRVAAWQENDVFRRQDLPPAFIPDGGVIAVRRDSLFQVDPEHPHAFLGRDRRGVLNEAGAVIDVDDEIDLLVAEAILERRMRTEASSTRVGAGS